MLLRVQGPRFRFVSSLWFLSLFLLIFDVLLSLIPMGQLSSKPSGSSRSRYGNPKSTSQLGRGGSTPSAGYFNFVSPHSTINNILRPEDKKKKPPVSGNGKNGSKPKLNKLKGVASNDRTNHKPEHKSRNENADSSRASKSKHAKQKKARSNSSSTQHGLHKRPPRPKEKKECIVCTDSRSLHRFPIRPPTTQCTHGVDVCRRCLRAWITSEFATKIWDEINCPICPTRMQHMDMQEFAPRGIFRRYILCFHSPIPSLSVTPTSSVL